MKALVFWTLINFIPGIILAALISSSDSVDFKKKHPVTIQKGPLHFIIYSEKKMELHHLSGKLKEPLPDTVTHLGRSYIVTSLGDNSMTKNFDLAQITLPDTITEIGRQAFYKSQTLTNVILPENLKQIKSQAFSDCSQLRSIYFKSAVPPTLERGVFAPFGEELVFFYPEEYKANWPEMLNGVPCYPWNPKKLPKNE